MFEKIASQCCNYWDGKCEGAFFKFVYGDPDPDGNRLGNLVHWIDSKLAGKPCLVTRKKYCAWFDDVVLPGTEKVALATKDRILLHQVEGYRALIVKQYRKNQYKIPCRRCSKTFWSDKPNKRYCLPCRSIRRAETLRKADQRKQKGGPKRGSNTASNKAVL